MGPDAPAASGRPRPLLLGALAAAVVLFVAWWSLSGPPAPAAQPAARPRTPAAAPGQETVKPEELAALDVRLEALAGSRPEAGGGGRNPFRFYTPPSPPAPPAQAVRPAPAAPPVEGPAAPAGPPAPPPITLKYIGLMEGVPGQGKVAAFSDCRTTMHGREGEIIAGQYRLVRIGVESVVVEYVDGRGRTTIRMSGQECVGK